MPIAKTKKTAAKAAAKTVRSTDLEPADRRLALIEAAFQVLSEQGFEGLRTREVAARAGVNIATLHYYFSTKEVLIASVADHLIERFRREGADVPEDQPLARLQRELADVPRRLQRDPALFTVLAELWLRADRDPVAAQMCRRLQSAWHGYLAATIRDGLRQGVLRTGLQPDAMAAVITSFIHGVTSDFTVHKDLALVRAACRQLQNLLKKEEP